MYDYREASIQNVLTEVFQGWHRSIIAGETSQISVDANILLFWIVKYFALFVCAVALFVMNFRRFTYQWKNPQLKVENKYVYIQRNTQYNRFSGIHKMLLVRDCWKWRCCAVVVKAFEYLLISFSQFIQPFAALYFSIPFCCDAIRCSTVQQFLDDVCLIRNFILDINKSLLCLSHLCYGRHHLGNCSSYVI